jgi:hypothetical protein
MDTDNTGHKTQDEIKGKTKQYNTVGTVLRYITKIVAIGKISTPSTNTRSVLLTQIDKISTPSTNTRSVLLTQIQDQYS